MSASRKRILYVEDDDNYALLITAFLTAYEVVTVVTLTQAWEKIQRERFDLYLLDYLLSDGVGVSLYRRIRSLDAEVPVIMLSSALHEVQRQKLMTEGLQAWLPKPVDFEVLAVTVRLLVGP